MGRRALRVVALPALLLVVAAAPWWIAAAATDPIASNTLAGSLAVRQRPSAEHDLPGAGLLGAATAPPTVVTFVAFPDMETRGLSGDGLLEVIVPPGAVNVPTTFTIALVGGPPGPPPGAAGLSPCHEVTADGDVAWPIGLAFNVWGDPTRAWVHYWDEALQAWLALPTTADLANHRLVGAADGPGLFQLLYNPNIPPLTDIRGHWAEASVLRLASLGLIEAPGGFFDPGGLLTRADFARMLSLALRLAAGPGPLPPADAPLVPSWALPYVGAVVGRGLMIGYPDGSFRALRFIRRDELATVLARALGGSEERGGVQGGSAGSPADGATGSPAWFVDWGLVPPWAQPHVGTAAGAGLIRGYPEPGGGQAFRAAAPATRSEGAAVIWRLLQAMSARR